MWPSELLWQYLFTRHLFYPMYYFDCPCLNFLCPSGNGETRTVPFAVDANGQICQNVLETTAGKSDQTRGLCCKQPRRWVTLSFEHFCVVLLQSSLSSKWATHATKTLWLRLWTTSSGCASGRGYCFCLLEVAVPSADSWIAPMSTPYPVKVKMCWIGKVWLFEYGSELLPCHNSTQAEGYCNLSCADATVSMAMFRLALA